MFFVGLCRRWAAKRPHFADLAKPASKLANQRFINVFVYAKTSLKGVNIAVVYTFSLLTSSLKNPIV